MSTAADDDERQGSPPVFTSPKPETTGDFWQDLKIAFSRLSLRDDLGRIGEIPCARTSLMSGIASGVGLGAVRALSKSLMSGFHWSMGTFVFISVGTWTICQRNLRRERELLVHVVEWQAKKRSLKRPDGDSKEARDAEQESSGAAGSADS